MATERSIADRLIPQPSQITPGSGEWQLLKSSRFRVPPGDPQVQRVAEHFAARFRRATGFALPVTVTESVADFRASDITLALEVGVDASEAYRLEVSPDGVKASAATAHGLFYALQSLRQLLPPAIDAGRPSAEGMSFRAPAVRIQDQPRFAYRGMHLDVGRHFFDVAFVKRFIDLMALYKFNTFHWHLTEDQGWRIEINKYPKLTEVGGYRRQTVVGHNRDVPRKYDGKPYGGYYTQDQIREVVAYAAERFITVVPEIEMPGHALAALAAYPELGCTESEFETATHWGIFEDVFCPSEETFAFLEGVLTEVVELFPSKYIHIGGDEVPKRAWKESPVAQALMRREGLEDEEALQSYFIRRIEAFLLARGRRLIGWDEILEGGLAPEATVMSWRGTEGGVAAARQGHSIIMTPMSHCYFDFYQADPAEEPLAIGGRLPVEQVYSFDPVVEGLSSAEAAFVLGGQGNVWTEYMKTPEQVEYMVFPRAIALAETLWSPRSALDYGSFLARLRRDAARLDLMQVNYARHVF